MLKNNKKLQLNIKFICLLICFTGIFANVTANTISGKIESTHISNAPSKSESNATAKIESITINPTTTKIAMVNKIVAFVNKGVITSNQVNTEIKVMQSSYKQKGLTLPMTTNFRNNLINQMITERVELDLAARFAIQTSDIEVTNSIEGIAKAQNLTLEQFKTKLLADGVSYNDLRHQAWQQLTTEKLKQREVDARIVVSDGEVTLVLNSEAYKKRIDYNLSYIIINVPEQATVQVMQTKKSLASQAYASLISGKSFNDVSAQYSNAVNALEGGTLGWKSNVALPGVIANALQGLDKGKFTNIIQLPMGFLIFKVNDVRGLGTPQIVKQYDVRHILVKVNENNSDDEAYNKINMLYDMLAKYKNNHEEQESEFIKLAKQYSDDTSSINGGDIGWVSRGDTVPAFETVMMNTPQSTISQPVRTPFGWHIIEVDAVRNSDQTTDREKATIRTELRDVKATLMYVEWLRNIRDSAYVKLNDD